MAEAFVALSLVGTIVQFVDFSSRVIVRLNELRSSAENVPNAFQGIPEQLRLLRSDLERTKERTEAGQLDDATQDDVKAVVQGCLREIRRIDDILNKIIPAKGDSRWRRGMKVILSVRQEDEIKEIRRCIESYLLTLIHHQTLNNQTALPTRPSPLRTPSFSTVPYERDEHFAGREDQLKQLDDLFRVGNRAALFGLGGIGKSQIAIEYSHRFQEMDPGAIILWVYASSIARIDEAYKEIARRAQLAGYDDPSISHLDLVSNWLQEDASGSWLLVVDNADIEDTFFKPVDSTLGSGKRKTIADYIPSAPNGKALITSRNRTVATRLTHRARVVEVPSLTQAEGRQMLENAIGKEKLKVENEVKRLLEALEHLPLAISQAAAFIDENHITIAEYLEILDGGDHELINVLSDDIEDSRRDRDSLNSVIASWKLSFDYLQAQKPRAAEILSLVSMLDCKSIPERLILSQQRKDADFLKAIGSLKSLSLVSEDASKKAYTVHRLVHLATRAWIEKEGDAQRWHKSALEAVDKAYPAGEVAQWRECSELEPHVEAVLASENTNNEYRAQTADLLLRSARDRYHQYHHNTALDRATKALYLRQSLCISPSGDLHIAQCLQMQSWCHYGKKDFPLAIETATQALHTFEQLLGPDAEQTMRARSNLSKFLTKNGDLAQAHQIQVAMLNLQRQKLGDHHSDVLYTMNRLVNTLRKQKRYDDAVELSEVLVAARRKASGDDHHATLVALLNYGTLLYDLGKTEDALAVARRVYEGQRKTMGEEWQETKETLELVQLYEKEVEAKKIQLPPSAETETAAEVLGRQQRELIFQPVLRSPDPRRSIRWSLP